MKDIYSDDLNISSYIKNKKISEEQVKEVCDKLVTNGVAEFLGYKVVDGKFQPTYSFDKKKLLEYKKKYYA